MNIKITEKLIIGSKYICELIFIKNIFSKYMIKQ